MKTPHRPTRSRPAPFLRSPLRCAALGMLLSMSAACSKKLKSGTAKLEGGSESQAETTQGQWTGHLGSARDGRSAETGWNTDWAEREPEMLWRASLGTGAAGLVIAGERLYGNGNASGEDTVFCFKVATGDKIWSISYPCELDKRMFEGGTAATPTLDPASGRLFVLSHEGELRCLNTEDGGEVWKRDYGEDYGGRRPRWGFAGAPLLVGGSLVVEPGGDGATLVALDPATGEERWRTGDDEPGYSAPISFGAGDATTVVSFNAHGLAGYAIADGAERFRERWKTPHDVNAATPVYYAGHIFVSSGYGKGAGLFAVGESGAELIYETRDVMTQFQSPVRVGEYLYVVSGDNNTKARLVCLRIDNGEVQWSEPLGGNRGNVIAVADKLIVVTERGEAILCDASPESFVERGRFQAIGGRVWAPPAFADGMLAVRNNAGDLRVWDLK